MFEKYNLAISRRSFPENDREIYKIYNARVEPFYCSLNPLFGDIPDPVAVVGSSKSLPLSLSR